MAIILGEAAHAHNAVQSASWLISVTTAKLRHTQRQVAIAFHALIENLYMGRAVHWLERMDFVVAAVAHFGDKHVFAKLVPMAAFLPKLIIEQKRCFHFLIIRSACTSANILLYHAPKLSAFIMPEHHALRFSLHVKQLKLLTKSAMIARFSFLEHM